MEVSDRELRMLVREAIARHLGSSHVAPQSTLSFRVHPSHGLLPVLRGGDVDGACLIEPMVRCSHCGYCQSYGH